MVDPDGAAVGERIGKVWRDHCQTAAARIEGTAVDDMGIVRHACAVLLPGAKPARPKKDAVEWNSSQEEPGGDRRAKMVALQIPVVGENFRWREAHGGRAQGMRSAAEENWSDADPFAPQLAPQREVQVAGPELDPDAAWGSRLPAKSHHIMFAVRYKLPDLRDHPQYQLVVACPKAHDHSLGIFPQQGEE